MTQESDGGLVRNPDADVAISGPDNEVVYLESQPDLTFPVPDELTIEEAARLKVRATELYRQGNAALTEADIVLAQSEIVLGILAAREQAAISMHELDDARDALAAAQAEYELAVANLQGVELELAAINPDQAGDIESQIAAHSRVYGLSQVLGPLRRKVTELKVPVDQARELVRSYERDSIPLFRAHLARREAALSSPPLMDLAKLVEVAPLTALVRGGRVGPALVTPETARTPHGFQALATIVPQLRASGLLDLMHSVWLSELRAKVDPKTFGKVERALAPPEPDQFQPMRPGEQPMVQMRDMTGGLVAALPGYDTAQGAAIRQAGQRVQYGPATWPPYAN